jgi:hypothetical protein
MLWNNGRRFILKPSHGGGQLYLYPTPINFGLESVPAQMFAPIQALLLSAAVEALMTDTPAGIQHPSRNCQQWIAERCLSRVDGNEQLDLSREPHVVPAGVRVSVKDLVEGDLASKDASALVKELIRQHQDTLEAFLRTLTE